MRDLDTLRRRLGLAVLCFPVVLSGCPEEPTTAAGASSRDAASPVAEPSSAPGAVPAPTPPPPQPPPRPTCPPDQLCPGGRLYVDGARAVVAEVRPGDGWAPRRARAADAVAVSTSAALARAWLEDARSEHASIASFARATLELLAVGAPASLVEGAQRAGLDEVRHARRCFELARAYGAGAACPGPLPHLPARPADIERLAIDTFVEGCVGETIAAICAARASLRAPGDVAAVWRMIHRDEARHAELAWKTVAWVVSQRPEIAEALLAEAEREWAAERAASTAAREDALEGRLSPAEVQAVRREVWAQGILPTVRSLAVLARPSASNLDDDLVRRLEALAKRKGSPRNAVIREAEWDT